MSGAIWIALQRKTTEYLDWLILNRRADILAPVYADVSGVLKRVGYLQIPATARYGDRYSFDEKLPLPATPLDFDAPMMTFTRYTFRVVEVQEGGPRTRQLAVRSDVGIDTLRKLGGWREL